MMQITDLNKEQQITPIWRLGFRPFFLCGAIFSAISILLWLLAYRGAIHFDPLGGGYWWHIHEMIFGFAAAIIGGFLLTAVQNWTGIRGVQGGQLILLFVLWLTSRLFIIFPHLLGNVWTSLFDLSFLPAVAYVLAKPIIAIKQYRNLFFIPLLSLFTIANALMHASIYFPDYISTQISAYACVLLVALLISIMAGRVTPMFTANGTQTAKATPAPLLDKLANGSLALMALLLLLHPLIGVNRWFMAIILICAGVFQTIRWLRWRPWITLGVPLLWSLHASIKALAFGLILLGVSYLIPEVPSNHIWHLLTVGGIGGVILAMISRVSLGHTGRPLQPPKLMSLAFAMIVMASFLRSFGPWGFPEKTLLFINISGFLWLLSFAFFALLYAPMLLKARLDGRPG